MKRVVVVIVGALLAGCGDKASGGIPKIEMVNQSGGTREGIIKALQAIMS